MQKNDDPGFVLCAYHLLLRGSTPKTSPGNPGAMVQFWYFFFPAGDGNCLVLETTLLDHGEIATGFVPGLVSGISL